MLGRVCSHPNKPLEDHLINTLELAGKIAAKYSVPLDAPYEDALLLHDLAKAHLLFQHKLCKACLQKNNCPDSQAVKGNKIYNKSFSHAEPAAVIVMALTNNLVAAEAVRRHHSALNNITDTMAYWLGELHLENVKDIISTFLQWRGENFVTDKLSRKVESGNWSSLLPSEEEWEDTVFDLKIKWEEEEREQLSSRWLQMRLFYSLLIAADRWEAAIGGIWKDESLKVEIDRIDEYLHKKTEGKPDSWRSKVRTDVVNNARKVLQSPGVYTLTLPTGTGKTLIGFEVAMEAAQRLEAESIIYVLPFVSLVDQNAKVASNIFNDIQEDHYLAYSGTETEQVNEDETDPVAKFISFFRYWCDPVVVTTFSKLWEVIYSPRANDAMSFHRLSRAVVVLDEPQSIPASYWKGFGSTLYFLAQELNSTFVMMTATQPKMLDNFQVTELSPKPVYYPKDRYIVNWLGSKNKMTLEQLVNYLEDQGVKYKDTMVVLNTRVAAIKMYIYLRNKGLDPFFLSGWVTPYDRYQIVDELMKQGDSGKKRCLVATQVIEAGMDLDFEMVMRDLAPLDSIIQVAGRCNRNGKSDEGIGEVHVVELVEGEIEEWGNRSYASYVYDSINLNHTRDLLDGLGDNFSFSETNSSNIISKYYESLQGALKSEPIWSNIEEGRWGEYHRLIKDAGYEDMLVIDHDGSIESLIKELKEMGSEIKDVGRKREISRILNKHSVNVPQKQLEEWNLQLGGMLITDEEPELEFIGKERGFWLLRKKGLGKVYYPGICYIPPYLRDEIEER